MDKRIVIRPKSDKYIVVVVVSAILPICFLMGIINAILVKQFVWCLIFIVVFLLTFYMMFVELNYNIQITRDYILSPIPRLNSALFRYKVFKKQKVNFKELTYKNISLIDLEIIEGIQVLYQRVNSFKNLKLYNKNGEIQRIDIRLFSDRQIEEIIKIINQRIKECNMYSNTP